MKTKTVALILLAVITSLTFASCDLLGGLVPDTTEPGAVTETETEGEETEEENKYLYTDPLTGMPSEKDLSLQKPLAVVVKNDTLAAPQFGLSGAGIVYEAAVEGGLTRFLALYSDPSSVVKVGPVIDSRTYFIEFAKFHESMLVQAGTTSLGNKKQVNDGVTALDAVVGELSPGFVRDPELIEERGYANSIICKGKELLDRATALGITNVHSGSFKEPVSHVNYLTGPDMSKGKYCVDLTVPFSAALTVSYKYSTLTDSYARTQYGAEHIDAATGKQLRFTNIILIYVEHDTADSSTGEMIMDEAGSGTGYYVYGGSYIPIVWKKDGTGKPIQYYMNDSVTPLQISAGNTLISVLSTKLYGKIVFE